MNRTNDSPATRRGLLRLIAGGAALAFARSALGGERRIDKLIAQAQAFPAVSERIGYISAALRGTRYRADTLVGGPHHKEEFVVRDDAFDCVTYIEAVLAAANAREAADYDGLLRKLRYRGGVVAWHERNHYFFDWCRRNVEIGLCGWLDVEGEVAIRKICDSQRGLETRRFTMPVIPRAAFLDNRDMLRTGDIVGFVSRRPDLDYFHTGLVAFDNKGALLLRHASEHARRVLDESMQGFLARWNVRYVTLVRPQERKPVS